MRAYGDRRSGSTGRIVPRRMGVQGLAVVVALGVFGCTSERSEEAPDGVSDAFGALTSAEAPHAVHRWHEEDWQIFEETVRWAWGERLDELQLGDAISRIGLRFVGTPYEAGTLEVPGPEALVINLRALDCVTFVENVLALASFVRSQPPAVLQDTARAKREFELRLAQVRYRKGFAEKYESRFHYFSEWMSAHENDGWLHLKAGELGGNEDPEPLYFMSANPQAYRQLADPETLNAIREMERRLNVGPSRVFVSEEALTSAVTGLQSGDVIAATSTVAGLDVAHTGFAVEVEGEIHLLHAPLVGDSVEVSVEPLAVRIQRISTQDGVMVGRPVDGPWFGARTGR